MEFRSVGFNNFEQETLENEHPVIVLCMRRGSGFSVHTKVLGEAAEEFSKRLVALVLDDEFVEPFRHRFAVRGTPTFLLFSEGREIGRLLGKHDKEALRQFIMENLALDRPKPLPGSRR